MNGSRKRLLSMDDALTTVLLVEDEPAEARLIQSGLAGMMQQHMQSMKDGGMMGGEAKSSMGGAK